MNKNEKNELDGINSIVKYYSSQIIYLQRIRKSILIASPLFLGLMMLCLKYNHHLNYLIMGIYLIYLVLITQNTNFQHDIKTIIVRMIRRRKLYKKIKEKKSI